MSERAPARPNFEHATGPGAGAAMDVDLLLDSVDREVALEDLLRSLIRRIARSMAADRGTLYLVDRARGELVSIAADLPELPEIRVRLGQGIAGHVARSGEVVNVPTTHGDGRFFGGIDEKTGYRTESILAVPMRAGDGRVIGVLQLLNKAGGAFTSADAARLGNLAGQAASVVQATTLYPALAGLRADGREALSVEDRFNRILGESAPMQLAYRTVRKAAPTDATVLILGETGTGKELFARALHVNSARRDGPMVKVDCAALPASLVENELFGHERGAFTGADRTAKGRVDAADGGTLFLDEIGELPLPAQGKLLRLLQDRVFERVGGTEAVAVDVRVVAATHRDLSAMIEAGAFRSDLYYRLNVVTVPLPPLRDRGETDLERLAQHFLDEAARRHGRPVPVVSDGAWRRLLAHRWPGNVRELQNCIESAVVLTDDGRIGAGDLPLPTWAGEGREDGDAGGDGTGGPGVSPDDQVKAAATSGRDTARGADGRLRTLESVEREHVLAVLEAVDGNRTRAAEILGIGRNTLARKLKAWSLTG